jgi:hypothetical protein
MRRLVVPGVVVVAALLLCGAPLAHQAFRMTAETVVVTVSVRDPSGRTPDLTAADFEIQDNGVRQTIDQAVVADLPIDATILIPTDWWRRDRPPAPAEIISEDLTRLSRESLRPHDRLRVLTSGDAHEAVAWKAGGTDVVARPPPSPYGNTIADSLLFALSRSTPPSRRQVIVLFEDRESDYNSAVAPEMLPALAAPADATLYVVIGRPAWAPSRLDLLAGLKLNAGISLPTSTLQVALRDAARATGGDAFAPAGQALDFAGAFRDMLQDLRDSYLVGFTPTGDRRPGFHTLTVKVKNASGLKIRARSGYMAR